MKALSVRQPWAEMIARGVKTVEVRAWATRHRGPLLIVATRAPTVPALPGGCAVCVVELADCRPMVASDEAAAGCPPGPGDWAWVLRGARRVAPAAVRGRPGLYEVEPPEGVAA